jgi:oxygen-dependent protoporphyrinogen oxidase
MIAHVIGAGVSGLASAWHLMERGAEVTVFESSSCPGGLIHSVHAGHGLVETAANAFVRDPRVDDWFARLGLQALSPTSTSRRRYIFRDGRPRRWPLKISESVTMGARIAISGVSRGFSPRDDETIASWGERVVGTAATRWLLEPAMQGIYAAPASALSAAVIFGGRRKGRREMIAPAAGMGSFVASLHRHLIDRGVRFVFDHEVAAIDPAVPTIIATNARQAARLLRPCASALATRLAAVRLAPLLTVTAFFTPSVDDPRGFGVLFPAESGVSALGVIFNADIFEGRSNVRSETWIVGDRASSLTARSDVDLLRMLANDRQTLTGRSAAPLSTTITRWSQAIPVYDRAVADVAAAVDTLPPRVALAGNYLGRIGVAALLEVAEQAAVRLTMMDAQAVSGQ